MPTCCWFLRGHFHRGAQLETSRSNKCWFWATLNSISNICSTVPNNRNITPTNTWGKKKNVSEPSFFGESMSWRNHPTPVNYAVSIPHGLVTSFTLLQHVVVFASLKKNCCQPAVFHEKKMGNHRHQDIMQKQPHISCKKKVFKQNIRISST